MHEPIVLVGESLRKKITGHYTYYGISDNYLAIARFYKYVKYTWFKTLKKRGQKNCIKYHDFLRIWKWLKTPEPKLYVNIW